MGRCIGSCAGVASSTSIGESWRGLALRGRIGTLARDWPHEVRSWACETGVAPPRFPGRGLRDRDDGRRSRTEGATYGQVVMLAPPLLATAASPVAHTTK